MHPPGSFSEGVHLTGIGLGQPMSVIRHNVKDLIIQKAAFSRWPEKKVISRSEKTGWM